MPTKITYLGHSSLIIEIDGIKLITDPVFSRRIFHIVRTAPVPRTEFLQDIDAILISHLHFDHLDLRSIKSLGDKPKVLVPKGAGELLKKNKITNFIELQIGDELEIFDLNIRTTPAQHINSRHPLGIQADCMGYLIEKGVSVYYPGDTQKFPEMVNISDRIDVALIPVWGWGPHLGRMHMSPIDAAESLTLLNPRLAIPIHWGTYLPVGMAWLNPAFHRMPPQIFAKTAAKIAPDVQVKILMPGESYRLEFNGAFPG